ncbi:MAG: HD domain-containing protein [Chloroflexota bacterium]|nr:MAG: phosphohydrolase [Chloroflexota bacterium]
MQHGTVEQHIADLLSHPKVVETRDHMHHSIPKHDHLMRSVKYSYRFARLLGADQRICLRAAIIHDIDSRLGTLTTHGKIAARWAADLGEPPEVCRAIESHMYPFGPLPRTREAWVLVLADKAATLGDLKQFVRGLLDGSSLERRRQLKQTDPFYRTRPRSFLRRLTMRRWLAQ